ncbi:hypothetical protein CVT26_000078, partial [Gymnopilus dilepis]
MALELEIPQPLWLQPLKCSPIPSTIPSTLRVSDSSSFHNQSTKCLVFSLQLPLAAPLVLGLRAFVVTLPRGFDASRDDQRMPHEPARMWRWDHPDDLICPGDPNSAWFLVHADGLFLPKTKREIQDYDFSVFGHVEIAYHRNWDRAVGSYSVHYHARRRRLELAPLDFDLDFLPSPAFDAQFSPASPSDPGSASPPVLSDTEEPASGAIPVVDAQPSPASPSDRGTASPPVLSGAVDPAAGPSLPSPSSPS